MPDDKGWSYIVPFPPATYLNNRLANMRFSQVLSWSILLLLGAAPSAYLMAPPSLSRTGATGYHNTFQPLRALSDSRIDVVEEDSLSAREQSTESTIILAFPVVASVSAFTFYEGTSKGFHSIVQAASNNNWIPVDGGRLIGDIILPAINGPVLGTIGLLFATLVSTTIGNLYQRQVRISSCVVQEVDDLRRLGYLLQSLPDQYREEAQTELKKFVNTIFDAAAAQKRSVSEDMLRNVTLTPIFLLLNRISDDVETDKSVRVSGNILAEGYELIRRINDQRTQLAVLLRPAFPTLHYANLVVLASCICLVFLVETDRDLIFFLAGFQLRLLWSILIGIFAMMASVIYDLESPFGGSYNVSVLVTSTVVLKCNMLLSLSHTH